MASPYGEPSPYSPPPYSTGLDAPELGPQEADLGPLPPPPPEFRPGAHPLSPDVPPLPRPRPAELVSRDVKANTKPGDKAGEALPVKLDATPNTAVAAPPAAPAAQHPASAAPKKLPPAPIPD
jgi:hypothetical protein